MKAVDPKQRFLAKVIQQADGCWVWTAAVHGSGRGSFNLSGKNTLAHRAGWIIFNGPIPKDNEVIMNCATPQCVNPAHAVTRQITRRTEPLELSSDFKDKFWRKVNMAFPEKCWPWMGYLDPMGFGTVYLNKNRTMLKAHRTAYVIANGAIEEGMQVYHTCGHRECCKPAHLFTALPSERGADLSKEKAYPNQQKQTCSNGHEFTPENTYVTAKGKRSCKQCGREKAYNSWALKNNIDPAGHKARAKSTTHCRNGHEFTAENAYTTKKGARACRECMQEKERERGPKRTIERQMMSTNNERSQAAVKERAAIILAGTIEARANEGLSFRTALYFWPEKGFFLWDDKPVHPLVSDYLVKHLFSLHGVVSHQGHEMIAYHPLTPPTLPGPPAAVR